MAAHQAPLSLGFSRQEHWSGLPFPSPVHESEKWKGSCSVVSYSSRPHGLQPTRLLRPWDFPGKSTGVGCHCLLWLCAIDEWNLTTPGHTFPAISVVVIVSSFVMRTLKSTFSNFKCILYNTVNCSCHAVHYIPLIYLFIFKPDFRHLFHTSFL